MKRSPLPLLLGFLLTCALPAVAADKAAAKAAPKEKPAAPVAVQPAPVQLNPIAQAAASAGVQRCAGRISQVTGFLSGSTQPGTILFVAPANQDRSIVSASMETSATDVPLAYASASFAPGATPSTCSGDYEQVAYWPLVCAEVAAKVFTSFKSANALRQSIQVLEGGRDVRVFLMPAGQGCVSIKKEAVY